MLRRRMKSYVAQARGLKPEHNLEGLDGPIQVHVKDGILIVPDSRIWPCYLVTDEEKPIVTRIGFDLSHRCARSCPCLDSWLHSHRATDWRKAEIRRAAANRELAVGEIVKHVAFRRMRLAPGVFMRADVGGFAIIGRAWIPPWDQVTRFHQDPVRYAVVDMAAVVVRVRWERSRERIDPRA